MAKIIHNVVGLIACILTFSFSIYVARSAVRDGIEVNCGKHLFKGKRKKNKTYPGRIRTFFLLNYLKYVDRGQYAVFLLVILGGVFGCGLALATVIGGPRSILFDLYCVTIIIDYILSAWVIHIIAPKK